MKCSVPCAQLFRDPGSVFCSGYVSFFSREVFALVLCSQPTWHLRLTCYATTTYKQVMSDIATITNVQGSYSAGNCNLICTQMVVLFKLKARNLHSIKEKKKDIHILIISEHSSYTLFVFRLKKFTILKNYMYIGICVYIF